MLVDTPKRVVVVGATGEIGRAVCAQLAQMPEYAVVVFSRDPERARTIVSGAAEYVAWQPEETGPWARAIDGAYAVISLADARTFGVRWTRAYRRYLRENRVRILRGLVLAMQIASVRPQVFIYGSSVGAYGFTTGGGDEGDEQTDPDRDRYAEEVQAVEREAMRAEALGIRTVVLRTGFILGRQGGGLPALAEQVRRGRGNVILPGTQ